VGKTNTIQQYISKSGGISNLHLGE